MQVREHPYSDNNRASYIEHGEEDAINAAYEKAINKGLAELSLKEFTTQAWDAVLSPKKPDETETSFIDNWHIDAITEHLEGVYNGDITRLLINIPPRTLKSTLTSVTFPAWCWTTKPWLKFLCASYADKLSTRDSILCRKIIQSNWYQDNWRDVFKFESDQNAKTKYNNDQTGVRLSTSVGGMATGEGGDIIIVDDPHNVRDTYSDVKREDVISWWDYSISTRLNNPKTGAIIIIMQRIHQADLSGHVLDTGGYDHLCLPMEYEIEERSNTFFDFKDPRSDEGELLHEERIDSKILTSLKGQLGSYGTAGQLQQRPAPLEGGIINIDWFIRYRTIPTGKIVKRIFQSWDTASKDDLKKGNAPWVCETFLETMDNRIYLLDVYREWMNYPKGKRAVKLVALKWHPNEILIEDQSTGESLLQELPLEDDFIWPLKAITPVGDKLTRMAVHSADIEGGLVYIPEEALWMIDFEKELSNFPNSSTKDQADALSQGLAHWRGERGDFWANMEKAMKK